MKVKYVKLYKYNIKVSVDGGVGEGGKWNGMNELPFPNKSHLISLEHFSLNCFCNSIFHV